MDTVVVVYSLPMGALTGMARGPTQEDDEVSTQGGMGVTGCGSSTWTLSRRNR